jgi:pantoate--beta-alanine ligase
MLKLDNVTDVRRQVGTWRADGQRIALVPTMGNLHEGHISLVTQAKKLADRIVVSIFVNPLQFGKGEDYERYPSTLAEDSARLAAADVDLLFAPDLLALWPEGTDGVTRVSVPALDGILCGACRPGHFTGVATVVAKLFNAVQPDCALFGEKDYQQLLVIRRMVADLMIPVEILASPIVRERDGLAMSSRNGYLNAKERSIAPVIYDTLQRVAERVRAADGPPYRDLEQSGISELRAAGLRPEYFSVRRASDLALPGPEDYNLRILVAAWLGKARLIDNLAVSRPV